jgi:hypothetical protein
MIQAMLAVADEPQVRAHPITPYIDWYMLALCEESRLNHFSFPDGASFPAWGRDDIAETQLLGHQPRHLNNSGGKIRGDLDMQWQVEHGVVMVHSIKHKVILDRLLKTHEYYVAKGAPPPKTLTIADYVKSRDADFQLREYATGLQEGETIRI